MALFGRKPRLEPVEYVELTIPRWFDLTTEDTTSFAQQDVELAGVWWQQMASLSIEAFADIAPVIRPFVDALLPVADRYEPSPVDPNLLAFHFAQGWWVAALEEQQKFTKNNMATRAAKITLTLLAGSSPGGTESLATQQFLEAGYYTRRKAPLIQPDSVARTVGLGATLSKSEGQREARARSQNAAGQEWMAERAAEKERGRQEWLREQRSDESPETPAPPL